MSHPKLSSPIVPLTAGAELIPLAPERYVDTTLVAFRERQAPLIVCGHGLAPHDPARRPTPELKSHAATSEPTPSSAPATLPSVKGQGYRLTIRHRWLIIAPTWHNATHKLITRGSGCAY